MVNNENFRNKKTFHIHIYRVVGKIEFDVEGSDDQEALMLAMEAGKGIKPEDFGSSECEFISMIIEEKE